MQKDIVKYFMSHRKIGFHCEDILHSYFSDIQQVAIQDHAYNNTNGNKCYEKFCGWKKNYKIENMMFKFANFIFAEKEMHQSGQHLQLRTDLICMRNYTKKEKVCF